MLLASWICNSLAYQPSGETEEVHLGTTKQERSIDKIDSFLS
jgi:hypothetical protein